MKTVIMAGGRGTRIASIAGELPKPMIKIGGIPMLEHEIRLLSQQGFKDIIITVGYKGDVISDYFGDGSGLSPVTGIPFDVHIQYYKEEIPLGNAGALFKLRNQLTSDFLLLNADIFFDIDISRFVQYHFQKEALATLYTHPNDHPYDSGLIIVDEEGTIIQWLAKEEHRPQYYKNCVNAGIHILSPALLDTNIAGTTVDLDRQILKPAVQSGKIYAYHGTEYIIDMGTPERYYRLCRDYAVGLAYKRNIANKKRAVFLDRDGTINEYRGFVRTPADFELLPDAAEAIREINNNGYLVIVVTNQPIIARGEVTVAELSEIHNKMETLLGEKGAYVDAIYYCPHHPNKGFKGEIAELKKECNCRKPKPGMLIQAAKDFNIDLSQSWMIGDSESDIAAGNAAGCKSLRLNRESGDSIQKAETISSLLQFTGQYLDKA